MRLKTILIVLGSLIGLVAAAAVAAIVVLLNTDFSQYRPLIAEKVKEATGRTLKIGGALKLELGLSPLLAVSDVSFSNAPWGSRPDLATTKRLEIQLDLLPILRGEISVRRLNIVEVDILLETDARGRGNWEFDAPVQPSQPAGATQSAGGGESGGRGNSFRLSQIGAVDVDGALLVFHDGETKKTTRFSLGTVRLSAANDAAPMKAFINGTYNAFYFEINGQTGSALALAQRGTPFPLDLTAKLGATDATVKIKGQFTDPTAGAGYDLTINAATSEMAQIADFVRDAGLASVKPPALGPLKAELRITDATPNRAASIPSFKLEAGRVNLALLKADGAIHDVAALKGVQIELSAEGEQIGALSGFALPPVLTPLPPIPALGPYRANVKLANGTGDKLAVPSFTVEIGREDQLHAVFDGAIRDPLEARGLAVNIELTARDFPATARQLNLGPVPQGPLSLRGKVEDTGPDRYKIDDLRVEAGGSDIGGDATLSLAGKQPAVEAELSSTMVDVARLIPPTGAAPTPAAPGRAPTGTPVPRPAANDGRLFSADPLPLDLLALADAGLRWKADTVKLPGGAPLRQVNLQAALRNGELTARQFSAELGGGKIAGELSMTGAGAVTLKTTARGVDLGALDKEIPGEDLVTGGKTDADIDLKTAGKSVRALMGGLNGSTVLTIGQGTFKSRYTDMLGLGGLTDLVGKSLPRQEVTQLNCTALRFEMAGGIATSRVLLVDTGRLTLNGEGAIDLGAEKPSMLIDTHTKTVSLLSFLPPIRVGGTLADPSFTPDLAGSVGGVVGDVLRLPGGIFDGLTGQDRPANNICAAAIARATGRAAPAAAPATPQRAPAPAQPPPAQPAPQQNPLNELGRGLRNLFGR